MKVNHQPESRMRETRPSGSEGGGTQTNEFSLPLSGSIAITLRVMSFRAGWFDTQRLVTRSVDGYDSGRASLAFSR